jgi:dipeptidase E
MKLLLTSHGLTNKSIISSLEDLATKSTHEIKLVYIITAAMISPRDKQWIIEDLVRCKEAFFKEIDILDIAAVPERSWKQRLEAADVLFFTGGSSFYLMYQIHKTGLNKLLPTLLQSRIYMGESAGSIVATPDLSVSGESRKIEAQNLGVYHSDEGLGLVPFYIRPHLNSPKHPSQSLENIAEKTKQSTAPLYAIDDNTALKVVDGALEIVSEGVWKRFN